MRQLHFSGRSTDSLLIFYKPSVSSCLHILGPDDLEDPSLPAITRTALPASNLKRISPRETTGYPPSEIFGPEPEHNWCYYYQKAALARQLGDWSGVISLADQASEKGYRPLQGEANTPQEWLPFVEAFARSGRADEAAEISRAIFQKDRRMDRQLCGLWVGLRQIAAGTAAGQVLAELGCLSPK